MSHKCNDSAQKITQKKKVSSDCVNPFLTQTEWWINPDTGSDNNNGRTPETALRTHREFACRISNGEYNVLQNVLNVHLPVGLPPSDPIQGILLIVDSGGAVRYLGGVANVIYSGTITALTPQNHFIGLPAALVAEYAGFGVDISAPPGPVGGQPWEITDAAIPDTALWFDAIGLGQRLRITSGPNEGLIAWALKDLTPDGQPNTLRTSNWAFVSVFPDAFITPGTPVVGDSYDIEELIAVTVGYNDVLIGVPDFSNPIFPALTYENLHIVPQQEFGGFFTIPDNNNVLFFSCKTDVDIFINSSGVTSLNCMNIGFGAVAGCFLFIFAGALMLGQITADGGGFIRPDGDFIIQSASFTAARNGGSWQGGSFAMFDSGALRSFLGSQMGLIVSDFGFPAVLWGSGNNFGCLVGAVSEWFFIDLAVGNIQGNNGDFGIIFFGAFTNTLAKIQMARAFDEAQGAGATYTDDRLCTWENLMVTPIAAGGFRDIFNGSAAVRPQSMSTMLWQRSF